MKRLVKVATAQFEPSTNVETNITKIREFVTAAKSEGAELVVFPEESMLVADPGTSDEFRHTVRENWDDFKQEIVRLATSNKIAIVACGYEPIEHVDRVHNTIVIVDAAGTTLAEYRKIHLYDAFHYKESDYVQHGQVLPPVVDINGFRMGIANCYDLRFPELFRSLSDQGADVLLMPAAWVRGPGKEEHWTTLLAARAIENVSWVVASGTVGEDTAGLSCIIDPLGTTVASIDGHDERIVTAELTRDKLTQARKALPALDNRRITLSYELQGA